MIYTWWVNSTICVDVYKRVAKKRWICPIATSKKRDFSQIQSWSSDYSNDFLAGFWRAAIDFNEVDIAKKGLYVDPSKMVKTWR